VQLNRLHEIVTALDALLGREVRLWRSQGETFELVAGSPETSEKSPPNGPGRGETPGSFEPVPGAPGYFFECGTNQIDTSALGALIGKILAVEGDTLRVAEELRARYEEIDLLYTISDILGRTIRLEEAADEIVREVSSVVGARRSSIFVHDEGDSMLRPVAGLGLDIGEFEAIPIDDSSSVAAQVFRENTAISGMASDLERTDPAFNRHAYRGRSFLSAPITYPDPNGRSRPVGVINLTDRLGPDTFSSGDRKLVAAIAHQIGAAIENARLVELDRQRQRVRRDLELAHDLQLRLLPSPRLIGPPERVAARCSPGEVVGGDFYQFVPLPESQIGVMLGDVSTHGLPAALIMALVLSAAGIHAAASKSPEQALQRLLVSVRSELTTTEMFLSLFYGVVDEPRGLLRYANAGHPHAFLLRSGEAPTRLHATVPPLGLADADEITGSQIELHPDGNILLVFSDGLCDARDDRERPFTEERVVSLVTSQFDTPADQIIERIFNEVASFSASAVDDQTMLILRT